MLQNVSFYWVKCYVSASKSTLKLSLFSAFRHHCFTVKSILKSSFQFVISIRNSIRHFNSSFNSSFQFVIQFVISIRHISSSQFVILGAPIRHFASPRPPEGPMGRGGDELNFRVTKPVSKCSKKSTT